MDLSSQLRDLDIGGGSSLLLNPAKPPQLPFNKWMCIVAPHIAGDETSKRYAPYATLELFVHRARGISADLRGKPDPYVEMQLNNTDLDQKTTVSPATLAPVWEESFKMDIYRPTSVLTLLVKHDHKAAAERGEEDVFAKLLGWGDQLIGYCDISISRLPMNETVAGWFKVLKPPNHWDNVTTRLAMFDAGFQPEQVGNIRLELFLRVPEPKYEFYAYLMGPPKLGEPLPELDLNLLFADILSTTKRIEAWDVVLRPIKEQLSNYSTLWWTSLILIVWFPKSFFPVLLLLLCLLLAMDVTFPGANSVTHSSPFAAIKDLVLMIRKTSYEPAPRPENSPTSADDEAEKLADPTLTKVLGMAKAAFPDKEAQDFKMFQRDFHMILTEVRRWEKGWGLTLFLKGPARAIGIGLCAVLIGLKEWQGLILKLILTWIIMLYLVEASSAVRMGKALYIYWTHSKGQLRLQQKEKEQIPDLPDSPKSETTRDAAATLAENRMARKKARQSTVTLSQTSLLTAGSSMTGDAESKQHLFEVANFSNPTWCRYCGIFLVGLWQQGVECSACPLTLCVTCKEGMSHGGCPYKDEHARDCIHIPASLKAVYKEAKEVGCVAKGSGDGPLPIGRSK